MVTDTDIREALRHVVDPEIGVNIVDLGLRISHRRGGGARPYRHDDDEPRVPAGGLPEGARRVGDPPVVGDLVDSLGRWRVWGGLLNAAAFMLFMFNTGRSMARRGPHGDFI